MLILNYPSPLMDHTLIFSWFIPVNADNSSDSHSFDLYSAIRFNGIDEDLREKLWHDGLHLTEEGYKVMGDVIAVRMFELLKTTQLPKNIGPIAN